MPYSFQRCYMLQPHVFHFFSLSLSLYRYFSIWPVFLCHTSQLVYTLSAHILYALAASAHSNYLVRASWRADATY